MPKKDRKKKNAKNTKGPVTVRSLLLKEDGQEYAEVLKMLGDRQVSLNCYDGVERRGKIRGNMRKRCWVNPGDHVLICMRDFTEKCVDVVHVYNDDEVKRLKKKGELIDLKPRDNDDNEDEQNNEDEIDTFVFEEL